MQPLWLLVSLLAIAGLAFLAYALGALDMLGAVASFFLGLLIALLGGLPWIFLMVLFTGLGFAATRVGYARKKAAAVAEEDGGRRGVSNVMGNGAAAGLAVLCSQLEPIIPHVAVQLAYVTAVAAVAADTLASELGALSPRARSILPPFAPAPRGQNGAVSLGGNVAAAAGAVLVAVAGVQFVGIPLTLAWIPALAGFLGCQVDSVLGATLERGANVGGKAGPLTKQDVNFLASAIPAILVLAIAALAL